MLLDKSIYSILDCRNVNADITSVFFNREGVKKLPHPLSGGGGIDPPPAFFRQNVKIIQHALKNLFY